MNYALLIIILFNSTIYGMQLAQAAKTGEKLLTTLIEKRNYDALKKILDQNPPWFDQGMHHRLKLFALNEFEEYGKQKEMRNFPRIVLTTATLFCSALSLGLLFFDAPQKIPLISKNAYHYCAGTCGFLGLKLCIDNFLINYRMRRRYEQAGAVYAIFASRSQALKKAKTETDIPKQTDN